MKIVKKSHTDHGLTVRQMAHLIFRFQKRDGFFIETFELPEHLGTVPAELYGPSAGDPPVRQTLSTSAVVVATSVAAPLTVQSAKRAR